MKKRPSLIIALFALLTSLTACANDAEPATTSTGATTTTTNEATTTVGPTVTTAPIEDGGCPGAGALEDGQLLDASEPSSDAEQISAIGWVGDQSCEVFTIEFTTDQGAPATTPPSVEAVFLREVGILRVAMDVEMTSITDQLAETALVRQVFVPRSEDRTLFVDLHLSAPALATVTTSSSPARILISLEPGGLDYAGTPAIAVNVVLVTPVEGPVDVPVLVNGYSRNFEANTIGRIVQGADVLAEGFTTAADWTETWGEFELTLQPAGSGAADLFVGEQSAQDGSDRGVVVPIDLP
ncbi:MAG TPA: Gmad2 immunoglobulin-like domain-containing protein [Acidimicrobiia bacterium]|nr:Gmad2 immunoglobulin-like domain-containing protein [Acidimicrobiia bacterium]